MKLREIFRFEFAYQIRRPWPWLAFAILTVFSLLVTRTGIVPVTLPEDFILNSPFIITAVTVISCQIWLMVAPAIAGEAAARDVHTGQYPLTFTSPVSKAEYLGGKFLAALALNAVVLLGVQAGSLLAVYGPGANPAIVGPLRPAAYLAAYGVALSTALIATTFQFSVALFTGRPMAAYVGSLLLFFLSYPVTLTLYMAGLGPRALLADPIGVLAIMNEMMSNWTLVEKNVRMFRLEGAMLWNRVLWLGVALGALAIVHMRFRFAHRTAVELWSRIRRRISSGAPTPAEGVPVTGVAVPQAQQSFGIATQLWQTLAIARSSFRMIVRSPAGLFLLVAFPVLLAFVVMVEMQQWGVPLLPRTSHLLMRYLTGLLAAPNNYWVMVPLITIYFAGELVWRERDEGVSENVDATPVPEWVLFAGKFAGLALVLAVLLAIVAAVGVAVQVMRGYYHFEVIRYLQVLLGLQLADYLLFAALAFAVHATVNQKYAGHLLALVAYFLIVFSSFLGVEHDLLVYASGPKWLLTDMRGFGGSIGPWLWVRLYWAAWALMLVVVARLWWVRGQEAALGKRMRIARLRFNRATATTGAVALGSILVLGGFIFYNTNVLNEYITGDELVARQAAYERQYGKYEGIPQPHVTATLLRIDVHPERRAATIRGSYRLVNTQALPIDSIHLEPARIATRLQFDRPARLVRGDEKLGHFIYVLDEPLRPGESLILGFDVRIEPRGFRSSTGIRNTGASRGVFENGSYFTSDVLPLIGYQPARELWSAEDRRKHGLPRQVTLPPPGDIDPHMAAVPPSTFDATISTAADQVGVAPGELRRTWSEGGRRYFHYVSDVPISGMEVFFSANYAVHRERWRDVDVQVFVHPGHTEHLDRLLRGVRASLDYYSSQFGEYPYRFLQVVEQPGNFLGMGVDGSGVVTGGEGIFLPDPQGEGVDVFFEVVAHEIGHQWWGNQLKPAFAEGGGVISESLAWYSAMQLVKHDKGRPALGRFMRWMREPNPWPPIRTGLPLLRAMDPWANYRKGPYALHALSEYIGEDRVNSALRTLLEKKRSSLATTLDMYRELQAVTPDTLKPLLADLFEKNTFWTFDTKQAAARQNPDGTWQVTFDVDAHKVVTDSAGVETEVPVEEMVEVGVFAPSEQKGVMGKPLYLQKHRIRSGRQSITVIVPERPAVGGVDPYSLLDWSEGVNIERIEGAED